MTPSNEPSRRVLAWKPITMLSAAENLANGKLRATDALRAAWNATFAGRPEEERTRARQRTLRRLAVETGIIERLYDIEWGLTLTLVAEGFTREVVERSGGRVTDATLATLKAQRDSLDMVLDFVRAHRPLTPSFIKELHAALTRTQATYHATDSLDRPVELELPHGTWKMANNHVERQDGSLLEYCPYDHVASEVDRLSEGFEALERRADVHPLVKAAWVHHRFVQIHPFADGNGRVARALTMLVLEKHQYAPLVVDRFHRDAYLRALDAANEGQLHPLILLFANLEDAAMTAELARPEDESPVTKEVARSLAAGLRAYTERKQTAARRELEPRAINLFARVRSWFDSKAAELSGELRRNGIAAGVRVFSSEDEGENPLRFYNAIVRAARTVGHDPNLSALRKWCSLGIRFEGQDVRFVTSLHAVGRDAGVAAFVTFALVEPTPSKRRDQDDDAAERRTEYIQTSADAFRFVHTETTEQLNARFADLAQMLDESLAVAVAVFMKRF